MDGRKMKLLVSKKKWLGWSAGESLDDFLRKRWVYSEELIERTLRQPDIFIGTFHNRERVAWSVVATEIERIEAGFFEELEDGRLLAKYLALNPRGRMATLARRRLVTADASRQLQGVF
jgi:hypothetical protein